MGRRGRNQQEKRRGDTREDFTMKWDNKAVQTENESKTVRDHELMKELTNLKEHVSSLQNRLTQKENSNKKMLADLKIANAKVSTLEKVLSDSLSKSTVSYAEAAGGEEQYQKRYFFHGYRPMRGYRWNNYRGGNNQTGRGNMQPYQNCNTRNNLENCCLHNCY